MAQAAAATDNDFLDNFHDEPRHDGPVAMPAQGAHIGLTKEECAWHALAVSDSHIYRSNHGVPSA
eukprot:4814849-Amphidinium_carterae.1